MTFGHFINNPKGFACFREGKLVVTALFRQGKLVPTYWLVHPKLFTLTGNGRRVEDLAVNPETRRIKPSQKKC